MLLPATLHRILPRRLRALLRNVVALADSGPYFSHPGRIDGAAHASLHATTRLTVLDAETSAARITLGDGVYLGREVELTAAGGGSILIDDDTSLQDGSIIAGHVRIGAHCLFGKYNFVASRGHNFRHRPTWLIRDQDSAVLNTPLSPAQLDENQIQIEEDCWFGQSVVVSPGVYVGRGAVVGSNAVVTSDIAPYEVHAGVPNKKIGTRLAFSPPRAISADKEDHIPYFYRGFQLSRSALSRSRHKDLVFARNHCVVVLAAANDGILTVSGSCVCETVLTLLVSGQPCGDYKLAPGPFHISTPFSKPPQQANNRANPILDQYTCVDLAILPSSNLPLGLSAVKLETSASKKSDQDISAQ